jgi:hypothetical protein
MLRGNNIMSTATSCVGHVTVGTDPNEERGHVRVLGHGVCALNQMPWYANMAPSGLEALEEAVVGSKDLWVDLAKSHTPARSEAKGAAAEFSRAVRQEAATKLVSNVIAARFEPPALPVCTLSASTDAQAPESRAFPPATARGRAP